MVTLAMPTNDVIFFIRFCVLENNRLNLELNVSESYCCCFLSETVSVRWAFLLEEARTL